MVLDKHFSYNAAAAELQRTEILLNYAIWAALIILGVVLLCVVLLLILHIRNVRSDVRNTGFVSIWRNLLGQVLVGKTPDVSKVEPNQQQEFLKLWLHFHESLRGKAKQQLNQVLENQYEQQAMIKQLKNGDLSQQIVVASSLGHTKNAEAWDTLLELMQKAEPALSIVCARSLLLIDAMRAADFIIAQIIERRDWSVATLSNMLNEAGEFFANRFLVEVDKAAYELAPYLPRLLHLVEHMQVKDPLRSLPHLLKTHEDPEVLAVCLRMLQDPKYIDIVRQLSEHPTWFVRVQAVNAIGRMGGQEDIPRLIAMLASPVWWIRYRAAQAIQKMPMLKEQDLQTIQSEQTDRYAKEILQEVLAEKEL